MKCFQHVVTHRHKKNVNLSFAFMVLSLVWIAVIGFSPPARADVIRSEAAQQGIAVSGIVSDVDGPLTGVIVTIKGTTVGVATDIEGKFNITVPSGESVLVFSFIGYAVQEIKVGDRTVIDVVMAESVQELEEVVVVGYGTQKKVTMVGSVAQVKGDDLLKTGAITSVSNAIQGLMPGVVAIASTSKPGADEAEIHIRGIGTWHSSAPLCLVDGVERDFNDVDPNEIESISVLKDAAATAVYGVKGGNGVILITTKRGTNQRPVINLTANFGFKNPTRMPEYTDYITAMEKWNEAVANDMDWQSLIPESKIAAWQNAYATGNYGPYNDYFPEVNWYDEMIKPWGASQQYNLNIRGGSNFAKYFVSFGFLNEGDIFRTEKTELFDPSFNYTRYNWRANLDFNLTKSTTFSINLAGKQGNRNQPGYRMINNDPSDNENDQNNQKFFVDIYTAARNLFPIQWSDGSYGCSSDGGDNLFLLFSYGQRIYKYYDNFVDLGLKQDLDFITKGLNANLKYSYTTNSSTQSRIQISPGNLFGDTSGGISIPRYFHAYDYSKPLPDGGYELLPGSAGTVRYPTPDFQGERQQVSYDDVTQGGYKRRLHYELSLNYARKFGQHNVGALAVFDRYQNDGLNNGSAVNMKFQEREEAWVTRETYNYAERYLLEFNGAYTGSMRFAQGKRFKFFPSYSIGWRLSEEPFIKNGALSKTLSNLKARYSYGTVGYDRNTSNFQSYIQTYNPGGANSGIVFGSNQSNASTFGPFILEGQTANVNATWETAYKYNLGFDWGLFDNQLTGSFDLFKERREGILMASTKAAWFGVIDPDANLGRTKSRGLEIEMAWNSKIGKDFHYWLKANFATSENRIVERNDAPGEENYIKWAGKPIGVNNARRLIVADYYTSLDDIYNYAGTANQNRLIPGDFMYIDYNAEGTISNNDMVPMGYLNYPPNTYGWSMGFSWKNFDFSMMWYGVFGVYKDISDEFLWDLYRGDKTIYYAFPSVYDCWTPETAAMATKPALHSVPDNANYSRQASTYIYRDASYLRLKNIEVSYALKQQWISKLNISKFQLYVNGNNLLTFTKFSDYIDPEAKGATVYPMVKRFNVGVRVGF